MVQKVLVKTDKNGTKYFHHREVCGRCSGTGIVACYIPINGGECFECWGSGIVERDSKEYTPEYEQKLQAQREKREAKKLAEAMAKADEINAEFFKKNGFNQNGTTYFVLGNTYPIKDNLKAQGAKWDNYTGHWHMAVKPEGLHVLEAHVDEMYDKVYGGHYEWNSWKHYDPKETPDCLYNRIQKAEEDLKAADSTSAYVGEIGEKLTVTATYTHTASWSNSYGYSWEAQTTYLHTFKDSQGNEYTWKTGKTLEVERGTEVSITGTVKEHGEYKGVKQTALTRCKIEEVRQ